jgi:regulator of sigma E protease
VSWLLAFLGFAALIILHEFGHFTAAKAVGMRVEKFSLFFGPMIASWRRGETTYGIGPIPLGGYVKITGMNPNEEIPDEVAHRAYYRQPVWKRIVVILAGPVVNLVIAFVLIAGLLLANGYNEPTSNVGTVERGFPAAGVLERGDKLVAVGGARGDQQALAAKIASHTCAEQPPKPGCKASEPAKVTVVRDGQERTFTLTPVYDGNQGRTRLGFGFQVDARDANLATAARLSAQSMWDVTSQTVSTIAGVFQAEKREQIGSVVGAYEATRQSFEFSTTRAISLLAIISLSLGVINLFPFLPLDGGHIFWAVAEKVRGRAIPFAVMERAGFIGFALVIGLFMIGLTNDIGRLTGEGFNVR